MGMRRKAAAIAVTLTAGAAAVAFTVGPAKADTVIDASYPVTGTTHINSTDSDLTLGPGTLTAALDLSDSPAQITGSMSLPSSTGSFDLIGFVPVTATVAFIPVGQVTGSLVSGVLTEGEISATAHYTIQLTDLKVAGIDVAAGPACETVTPAAITVTSPTDFNAVEGGTLTGTYTIPDFKNCGPLGSETWLINDVIPGAGNTISLDLGTPALSEG